MSKRPRSKEDSHKKFSLVERECVVAPDDLESDEVQLFLIKCPPEFDISALHGKSIPEAQMRKRARISASYDLEFDAKDVEASQIRIMIPVSPEVVDDASNDSEEDAEATKTNVAVTRKLITGTLKLVAPSQQEASNSNDSFRPVVLSKRVAVRAEGLSDYKYLPLGYGSPPLQLPSVGEDTVVDTKQKKHKKAKKDKQ